MAGMNDSKRPNSQASGLYTAYFEGKPSQVGSQRTPMTVEEMLKMKRSENLAKKI